MIITRKNKVREAVSALSSGRYYDEISHWHELLTDVLTKHGLRCITPECPQAFNDEGAWNLWLETEHGEPVNESVIHATYYRMQSGRWEIINYIT